MTVAHISPSFARIALHTPQVRVGDIRYNIACLAKLVKESEQQQAEIVGFPELSMTGYSMGDLFESTAVLHKVEAGLIQLAQLTSETEALVIVGAPLQFRGDLYNCAVAMQAGHIVAVIPKSYVPNYKEFYEKRWFRSGRDIINQQLRIGRHQVPFGVDILLELAHVTVGIEICEDVWAPNPPSVKQALNGADVIVNLSASNELVGKADFRKSLVVAHSARIIGAYAYVSTGYLESTADVVFSGHSMVAENGYIIAEGNRFVKSSSLYADVDIDHIRHDRRVNTTFESEAGTNFRTVKVRCRIRTKKTLIHPITVHPFVPDTKDLLDERAEEILNIQSHGLASFLDNANIDDVVLGLSGGLDSTLALLVSIRAMKILGNTSNHIRAITMPGLASSSRTQINAKKLAKALGVKYEEIPISTFSRSMLKSLGHDGVTQDTTYENAQARVRTEILMNISNRDGALVVGTGDLSEIALGWCTFNGDHMSMYNVNASIPKTLVRHLVKWMSLQADFIKARDILDDILATPISPELVQSGTDIEQKTEDIIGPYELHDFFLYYLVRHGDDIEKIRQLAMQGFSGKYSEEEIQRWLSVFISRFTSNQFKRESAPNGPKVGTVSLSQRGDWRMPPGASANWCDKI